MVAVPQVVLVVLLLPGVGRPEGSEGGRGVCEGVVGSKVVVFRVGPAIAGGGGSAVGVVATLVVVVVVVVVVVPIAVVLSITIAVVASIAIAVVASIAR